MNQLRISSEGGDIRIDLDGSRDRIQQLITFELRENGEIIRDQLYIQLEISREEQDTSREVMNRLANRDAPFTHMRVRSCND